MRLVVFGAALFWAAPSFAGDLSGRVLIQKAGAAAAADLEGSVVYIDAIRGQKFTPPAEHPTMASHNKAFLPTVVAIQVGTSMDFPNDDTILHNVFSLSKPKPFDLGLYKNKGDRTTIKFDKPGLIKVFCNIHESMAGFILVLQNPYFALTDKSGLYEIKGVPSGVHKVKAWSRFAPEKSQTITVGDSPAAMNIELIEGEID